jgi:hypothetical protein
MQIHGFSRMLFYTSSLMILQQDQLQPCFQLLRLAACRLSPQTQQSLMMMMETLQTVKDVVVVVVVELLIIIMKVLELDASLVPHIQTVMILSFFKVQQTSSTTRKILPHCQHQQQQECGLLQSQDRVLVQG